MLFGQYQRFVQEKRDEINRLVDNAISQKFSMNLITN